VRYALALLTSPGREDCLERTLASFERNVRPRPSELVCHVDGGGRLPPLLYGSEAWTGVAGGRRRGFCEATATLWWLAAESSCPWVFWLEDDFELVRAVDLTALARVLLGEPHVAQMSLCRQAVNSEEIAAGGLVASRPGAYVRRGSAAAWLEHREYWTTNPSLFRTQLARSFPWPTEQHCEGVFTHGLLASLPATSFGVWGVGDVWAEHIGVRQGAGY